MPLLVQPLVVMLAFVISIGMASGTVILKACIITIRKTLESFDVLKWT